MTPSFLKPGDQCLVVSGFTQHKSPNTGKTVTIQQRMLGYFGENHGVLGRIWRCEGEGVQQLNDSGEFVVTGWADFAECWLVKIDPLEKPTEVGLEQVAGDVYTNLLSNQEPLGAEFQKVLDKHLWDLYEN